MPRSARSSQSQFVAQRKLYSVSDAHPSVNETPSHGTVNLFWRIATEIYSLGEFQSLLHHSALRDDF